MCFKIKEGDLKLSWFSQLLEDIKNRGNRWQGTEKERLWGNRRDRRLFIFYQHGEEQQDEKWLVDTCKDSFRHLKIYSLYIHETILYVKEKCNCTVNKQIHTHNTRNTKDYHIYGHNLEIYNSKPSVAGCTYYNKLPNNIKEIENINQFKKKLKELLIKGCYYTIDDYLNEDFFEIGYWLSW